MSTCTGPLLKFNFTQSGYTQIVTRQQKVVDVPERQPHLVQLTQMQRNLKFWDYLGKMGFLGVL